MIYLGLVCLFGLIILLCLRIRSLEKKVSGLSREMWGELKAFGDRLSDVGEGLKASDAKCGAALLDLHEKYNKLEATVGENDEEADNRLCELETADLPGRLYALETADLPGRLRKVEEMLESHDDTFEKSFLESVNALLNYTQADARKAKDD